MLSACNSTSLQPTPTQSPIIDSEQTLELISTRPFIQTTSIPTSTPQPTASATIISRAYENGQPLVARVDNHPLFLTTYKRQLAQFEQVLIAQGTDLSAPEGQTTWSQIQHQVLESLLDQLIIEQQAEQLGIIVTDEAVETIAQETIRQIQNHKQFEIWLSDNDLTYQEFIDKLHSQLIANKVFEHVSQNVSETAEQIWLRAIWVQDRERADDILEALKNGKSFIDLAQQHTLPENNQANGADLGWFPKSVGLIPVKVEEVAFLLQAGEISGPIQESEGFYIIKLESKEADRLLSKDIQQILKKQIFDEWLNKQRSATVIEKYIVL